MFTETSHRNDTSDRDTETQRESSQKKKVRRVWWLVVASSVLWPSLLVGQQLLDRVVARVDGYAITLTDVHAALGLGVIQAPPGADSIESGTQQMIDRQLLLAEVQRFPPPEPNPTAVDRAVEFIKMTAGPRLTGLMQSTGLTEARIRDIARDELRIFDYLNQRFGA